MIESGVLVKLGREWVEHEGATGFEVLPNETLIIAWPYGVDGAQVNGYAYGRNTWGAVRMKSIPSPVPYCPPSE